MYTSQQTYRRENMKRQLSTSHGGRLATELSLTGLKRKQLHQHFDLELLASKTADGSVSPETSTWPPPRFREHDRWQNEKIIRVEGRKGAR